MTVIGTCDGCDLHCPIVDDVDAYVKSLQVQGLLSNGDAEPISPVPAPTT